MEGTIGSELSGPYEDPERRYSPPQDLPFVTTNSYEGDRDKYVRTRDMLYGENTKSLKEKMGKKASLKEVLAERRKLAELDNFFDIVDEC